MTVVLDLLNNDPRPRMRPDMPRHPEKANRPDTPIQSKPAWNLIRPVMLVRPEPATMAEIAQ